MLTAYIEQELDIVTEDIPSSNCAPEDFYKGASVEWESIRKKYDIRRRVTDDILIESVLDSHKSLSVNFFVLKGYAGSGKSITLRRVAWDSATEYKKTVLWLRKGGIVRYDLIEELCDLTEERVFLFVEDALHHSRELEALISIAIRKKLELSIVAGARTNEWNVSAHLLENYVTGEYELRDLAEREIEDLLSKLENTQCLGELEKYSLAERKAHFLLTSQRQLLVALHEATSGKSFEEIVENEYQNIVPTDAQTLYLDVCTLHRFGVGVRAGLISRVSGVGFSYFKERLLGPLEHVVSVYHDAYSRDFAYSTRHSLVADIVFRRAFSDMQERADQIVRVVSHMNTDYESDKKAFIQLVRGKELAELFSDRALADRVFEAALESGAARNHVEHQKAIFELNHDGGSLVRADKALDLAEQLSSKHQLEKIQNTRAVLLRRLAHESTTSLASEKYRGEAEKLLEKLCRGAKSSHPFHALGRLYLDEFEQLADSDESREGHNDSMSRVLETSIKKIEKTLGKGLALFPEDSYLRDLEASLAKKLKDTPRALSILEKSNNSNPHDQYIAIRLSDLFINSGKTADGKMVLYMCLERNPNARRAKLRLGKILISENDDTKRDEIGRLLRSGFSNGDTNYDTQFWYARHEYLFGKRAESLNVFESLAKTRKISHTLGFILDPDGNKKRFTGTIKKKTDNYCFVRVDELNDDVFVHFSDCQREVWHSLKYNSTTNLYIGFNNKGPVGVDLQSGYRKNKMEDKKRHEKIE